MRPEWNIRRRDVGKWDLMKIKSEFLRLMSPAAAETSTPIPEDLDSELVRSAPRYLAEGRGENQFFLNSL